MQICVLSVTGGKSLGEGPTSTHGIRQRRHVAHTDASASPLSRTSALTTRPTSGMTIIRNNVETTIFLNIIVFHRLLVQTPHGTAVYKIHKLLF